MSAAADRNGPSLHDCASNPYIADALAAQAETLNTAYNARIASAVKGAGAALVDIDTLEAQAYASGGIPITPTCCSVTCGGGLYTLDGLHLSNTFNAIVANGFIGAIDKAFGKNIPACSPTELETIAADDPFAPK
jgi:hypothetical protein